MRLLATLAIAMVVTGCAEIFRNVVTFPITRQRAIQVASEELRRRGIAISPRWPVDAFEGSVIVEFAPEIPIYEVEFYAPGGRFGYPRYSVSVYKYGGGVYYFSDSATLQRASKTSNHPMELTASRRTPQFFMAFMLSPAATRAPARSTSAWSR